MKENLGLKNVEASNHAINAENFGRDWGAIGVFAYRNR
jgi:hypothetical protein